MKKIGMLFAFVAMAAFVVSGLVAGNVLAVNTSDTADMSLSAKSDTDILRNGKVQVGISIDTFSITNGEGYDGWQVKLNYSNSLNVQDVEFLGGPGENPLGIREWKDHKATSGPGSVLIGANNLPGEDGSNFKGQLAVVTFVCNAVEKTAQVDMKGMLVITHQDKDINANITTGGSSIVDIDCRQALLGLAIKGDAAHFVEANPLTGKLENHIKVAADNPFTITVILKDVVKLKDEDQVNDTGGYKEVHTSVVYTTGPGVLNATDVAIVVPGCISTPPTAAGKGGTQTSNCTTFADTQSDESKALGAMVEITFVCQGAGDVVIALDDSPINKLVAEDGTDINTHVSQPVNVECIADGNDKDGDNCRHLGTSGSEKTLGLDPNFYDFPNDKDTANQVIDIQDINNYVNFFGFPPEIDPDGPGPITKLTPKEVAQPIDDELGITDIAQAVSLFGQSCQAP